MLTITLPGTELWDEATESFATAQEDELTLRFEHSLISLSKWESKFQKAFLGATPKTAEETLGYIEAMCLDELPVDFFQRLKDEHIHQINEYIDSKQSATTFGEMPKQSGRAEIVTSELIYYWMVAFNIPFECESWHLNRLFSLIRICNVKNSKPKKMNKNEIAQRNREINEQRKAKFGTKG